MTKLRFLIGLGLAAAPGVAMAQGQAPSDSVRMANNVRLLQFMQAFQLATSRRAPYMSALDLALDGGLAPALTVTEMQALASVVTDLQRQILEGRRRLSLDPEDHRKHVLLLEISQCMLELLPKLRLESCFHDTDV